MRRARDRIRGNMSRSPGPLTNAMVGRYRVGPLLGRGGMGEVYRADDPELRRAVGLKVLPESVMADPGRLSRFIPRTFVVATRLVIPGWIGDRGAEESNRDCGRDRVSGFVASGRTPPQGNGEQVVFSAASVTLWLKALRYLGRLCPRCPPSAICG